MRLVDVENDDPVIGGKRFLRIREKAAGKYFLKRPALENLFYPSETS